MSNQIFCCYIKFPIGSARYVQLFLEVKLSHWLECFNNCAMLVCLFVLAVFLAWPSRLKIQKSYFKASKSLLNFSALWNQNIKLKMHKLCHTDFILISSSLWCSVVLKKKIISLVRMFQKLRNAGVLARDRCFLAWANKLKI